MKAAYLVVLGGSVVACMDAAPTEPAATARLAVRMLSDIMPPRVLCLDLAVSNGVRAVWSTGNPKVTSFGADQTSASFELADGDLAPDRGAVCVSLVDAEPAFETTLECDRDNDVNVAEPGVQNELTFWIDELNTELDAAEHGRRHWVDPCPDGCKIELDCEGETTVDIGLSTSNSTQGFADYAALVDGAWCLGKVDSCTDLLFDDANATRVDTAIVGFACTAPPGIELRMDALEVICDDARFSLALDVGRQKAVSGEASLGYSIFLGTEDVVPGYPKTYVNQAIRAADLTALGDCRLRFDATAVTDPDVFEAPADATIYPVFSFDVALTKDGEATCDTMRIDGMDTSAVYRGNAVGFEPLPAFCTKVVDGVVSRVCQ